MTNEKYISLKYYAYDRKLKWELLLRLTDFIKSKKIDQTQLFFRNGWIKGSHVNIVFSKYLDEQEDLKQQLVTHLQSLKKTVTPSPNYEQHEAYVKRLKIIEGVKEDVLPLEKEHQIILDDYTPGVRNMMESNATSDYFYSTPFLVNALKYFYSLNKSNQLLFLAKLIVIFSNIENSSLKSDQGIYLTYYSLRSHMDGFINSIKEFPDKQKQKFMDTINYEEQRISKFINQGFKEFIYEQRNGYKNTSMQEKEIFLYFEECIYNLLKFYRELYDGKQIILEDDMTLKKFLDSGNLSDFHNRLKTNFNISYFNSREFIVGRLIMNWYYQLLPLFSISPLEKITICNILNKSVEKDKGKNYNELLEDLEITYKDL